jgi:membrane protein implicated in regulation of membrane protease activity
VTTIVTPLQASDQEIHRLRQQVASAQIAKELSQLDLEWERERQAYLLVTERNPAGEIPDRPTAIGFRVVGGVFLLALMLGAVLVTPWLLLLLSPLMMVMVIVIATWIHDYRKSRTYQRGMARYLARRSHIESSSCPALETVHSSGQPLPSESAVAELIDQIAEERYQAALAGLDREWEIEQGKHYILPRRGERFIPTRQHAFAMAVAGIAFGAVMLVTQTAFFSSFGVVFALLGIGGGFHLYSLARKYEHALSTYETRRKQLCREQFANTTPDIRRHGAVSVKRAEGDAVPGTSSPE